MRIVGIKAGSSIFQDEEAYPKVARLLVPLTRECDQLFFVVSAVKGATDRTIDEIARERAAELGLDFERTRYDFDQALRGNALPYITQHFNNTQTANRLVTPEGTSVANIVRELTALGIDTVGMEHGPSYPLIGLDDGNFLYATPDITSSRAQRPEYSAQVVVVPGFAVRSPSGEIMCTGRGSSDLTLSQMGEVFDIPDIIYWKDTGGFLVDPSQPELGIYSVMLREQARELGGKVLDLRVYDSPGRILITKSGKIETDPTNKIDGGTIILRPGETLEDYALAA